MVQGCLSCFRCCGAVPQHVCQTTLHGTRLSVLLSMLRSSSSARLPNNVAWYKAVCPAFDVAEQFLSTSAKQRCTVQGCLSCFRCCGAVPQHVCQTTLHGTRLSVL